MLVSTNRRGRRVIPATSLMFILELELEINEWIATSISKTESQAENN